jgi:hypothetical protein
MGLLVILCLVLCNKTSFKSVTVATGDSVYLFLAAKNPLGSVIAVVTAVLQVKILYFFVSTKMNAEVCTAKTKTSEMYGIEDYMFTETSCSYEDLGLAHVCIIAILCGNMLSEFTGALRILTSKAVASVKLTGCVMLLVSSFNFVVTFAYGMQQSESMEKAIIDVGALCFVSSLDEQIFAGVMKYAPIWVEKSKKDADQALATAAASGPHGGILLEEMEQDEETEGEEEE